MNLKTSIIWNEVFCGFIQSLQTKPDFYLSQAMVTSFEIPPNSQFTIHLLFDAVWTDTYLITYLLTYLITQWNRVLEKLIGSQLVEKFVAFYGTKRFIIAFTHIQQCKVILGSYIIPITFTGLILCYLLGYIFYIHKKQELTFQTYISPQLWHGKIKHSECSQSSKDICKISSG